MLKSLHIRNLALVDRVEAEFQPGLNVITGETGAGKSLLMGALKLLLGERADRSMIRTGETQCLVQAVFQPPDPEPGNRVLAELGLEPTESGELLVRRVITESASRAFINDMSVTLQALKQLGDVLVDMHGPYDHQSLLHPETQLEILDVFGRLETERTGYAEVWRKYRALQRRIDELNARAEQGDLARQIEFLEYRVREIAAAALSAEEEAQVLEEHALLANAQQVIEYANAVMQALTEGEGCAFEGLGAAQRALAQLAKTLPEAALWRTEIEQAATVVQETVRSVEQVVGGVDAGPERMQWLEERLGTYQTLRRKYGPSLEEVLENGGRWAAELKELQSLDERRLALQGECDAALREVLRCGQALHAKRMDVADRLSEAITRELVDLGFEHGFFDVQLTETEPSASGTGRVEFGFAPNAGEEMRPLRAIASSGEISRVMLAVKAVLAQADRIPLLVFDEIDANVGGQIANAVGDKLRRTAEHHQVLCITHLPQVAACGTAHYAVAKEVLDGRTYTRIQPLTEEERVGEIARMLGGRDRTGAVMQHARELIRPFSE